MGEILLSLIGERLLAVLPDWLRRRLYPDARLPREVTLRLRGEKPIQVNVSAKPSELWVYFEVENHNPVDIVLDRIVLFLWATSGGSLADGVMANRHAVTRHSTSDLIAWRSIITAEAADVVRRQPCQFPPIHAEIVAESRNIDVVSPAEVAHRNA